MRKLITIFVLVLALAISMVSIGQASSRPYTPEQVRLIPGGTTDDHPWGGDNADDNGSDAEGVTVRPGTTGIMGSGSGYWLIDFMATRIVRNWDLWRTFNRPSRQETIVPTSQTTTPTANTTTAN